jgi:murein L,D-transpeptidase YcbB/YkuD
VAALRVVRAAIFTATVFAAPPVYADDTDRAIRSAFSHGNTIAATPQDQDLKRLYELLGFQAVWTQPSADAAQQALARAGDEGLNPADYRVEPRPPPATTRASARTAGSTAAAWDIQLTRVFLHYARDVHSGRIAPDKVFDDVSLPPQSFDAPVELAAAVKSGTLARFITALPPQRPEYAFLREALLHYRALEARGEFTVPARAGVPLESLSAEVRDKLRLRLAADDAEVTAADKGPALRNAVRRFQARFGLQQSGTLTAETVAVLKQPISHRVLQIEANMERWRWLPVVSDKRYVEVNTPDASLKIVENGKAIFTSPVILGQRDWATPILATAVQAVVVNPPWHVPSDLAGEEILPKLIQDASYLAAHNMVLIDGPPNDPNGRSIKWRDVPADPFPYSIQQMPGPRSGLGALLLDMPNGFGVYLHDTPDKDLFTHANRFLSHGCVRVRGIAAVASYALYGSTQQAEKMPHPPRTETQRVALDEPLPVYMLYWTVFRDADGAIAFRQDTYGRDVRLIAALYGRDIAPVKNPAARETVVAQAPAP